MQLTLFKKNKARTEVGLSAVALNNIVDVFEAALEHFFLWFGRRFLLGLAFLLEYCSTGFLLAD